MKKVYSVLAITFAVASLLGASAAYAVPTLQLDIEGGTYDPVTQTIISSGPSFTLYGLLTPDQDTVLGDAYYISAAIVPKVAEPGANLGSFTFNGNTIAVTADMTYGTPPIATVDQDLASHGIFETYFSEFEFQFAAGQQADPYDTADDPGGTLGGLDTTGTGSYWAAFLVDVSGLNPLYAVHFDLYTYGGLPGANNRTGITEFAPFSHDAQSKPIPEPATMLLFGTGLAGLAGIARRRRN